LLSFDTIKKFPLNVHFRGNEYRLGEESLIEKNRNGFTRDVRISPGIIASRIPVRPDLTNYRGDDGIIFPSA
jgi:hypothetical protein